MKRVAALLGVVTLIYAATPVVDPKFYIDDVKYLASPELKGRATGSPELEKAADFISGKFKQFGVKPPVGKSYYQAFSVTTSAKPGPHNSFRINGDKLELQKDYTPFSFSHSGKMTGSVVFAGYGITAPEYHYDDYAGIDVKGRVVLILRHEPQEADEKSVFGGKQFTQHAQFAIKASNAKMHGAAGVIVINDVPNHNDDEDKLAVFGTVEGPADAGIPFVQVKETIAEKWFAAAGKSVDGVIRGIDQDLKPESFAFPASLQLDANVDLERLVKTVHNVAAYLPGTTNEYVIIGAHYDHLGLGGQFSLAPSMTGTVHPGADDNASGTSGVIELARYFSKQPKQKRGILFLTFAGEELGLLGSAFWANNPEIPLENAVSMLNMDMIGRAKGGKLFIGGSATGSSFRTMLDKIVPNHPEMKVDYSEGPESGSSDHTSFISKKVPSLFFFSGLHSDYHKPSDTWDKIDGPATANLLSLVADIAEQLREADGRPEFQKPAVVSHGGATGDGAPVSGYGPWFGSVPDFAEGVQGVKFADVTAGSPAAAAGLKGGDVMVSFDGKAIQNLYDFTYALRGKKPGDEVMVKVMRDGKPLEVKVTLSSRR
jgi:Zn-dependent M28 family amino/carboxypeptidase